MLFLLLGFSSVSVSVIVASALAIARYLST